MAFHWEDRLHGHSRIRRDLSPSVFHHEDWRLSGMVGSGPVRVDASNTLVVGNVHAVMYQRPSQDTQAGITEQQLREDQCTDDKAANMTPSEAK